jgi:hypothetical protein
MVMERDREEQAALVLGALEAVASLCELQTVGLGIPSEDLAPLLRLVTEEVEKVLSLERRSLHGRPANTP